jgi:hypothetical protein
LFEGLRACQETLAWRTVRVIGVYLISPLIARMRQALPTVQIELSRAAV